MLRWRMADRFPMVLLLAFTRSGVFPGGYRDANLLKPITKGNGYLQEDNLSSFLMQLQRMTLSVDL
jgi:hypothetical protein